MFNDSEIDCGAEGRICTKWKPYEHVSMCVCMFASGFLSNGKQQHNILCI